MRLTEFLFVLPMMALSFLASCQGGSGNGHFSEGGDTIPMRYARNLSLVDYGDFTVAKFRNPWDTTKTLQTFVLVPRDHELTTPLPEGTVIRVPIERSIVYTSVHSALIDELGRVDAITGVCDARYIFDPEIQQRLADGKITDCGATMAPNVERILMLKPDAILLSAYENSNDHNKVGQLGIPIIDCTDYMETSPLARAEWMRFFGRLYGEGAQADSLFDATVTRYDDIKHLTANVASRPTVLTEKVYGQSWAVPGALSTVGVMIEDAGGRNAFDRYKKSGSVQLAPEQVLYEAKDADIWLVKYAQLKPLTLQDLASENGIYPKFKAYNTGQVYGCDTERSAYFEEAAFHPHWILAEMASLFHPELGIVPERRYYHILAEK